MKHLDPTIKELYYSARRVKRSNLFKNHVLDFARVLFIDQPMPQGPEVLHEAIHRMGKMATPGGRLCGLETACIPAAKSGHWALTSRAASGAPSCPSTPARSASASSPPIRRASISMR
jgi:hypothetical protein